jgi:chromosome segregation ATPase
MESTDPWIELALDSARAASLQAGGIVELECTFFSLAALFMRVLESTSGMEALRAENARLTAALSAYEDRLASCESQTQVAAISIGAWQAQVVSLRAEQSLMTDQLHLTQSRIQGCESRQTVITAHLKSLDDRIDMTFEAVQSILKSRTWTTLARIGAILHRITGRSPG